MKSFKNLRISIILVLSITTVLFSQQAFTQENDATIKSFFESLNAHDVDKFISHFTEDCLYEDVQAGRSYTSKEAIATYIGSTISGIPDSEFDVTSVLSNDQMAIAEWIWKGTNSVGWPQLGIPPTNKYFELRGVTVMKIEGTLIKRVSDYWDWQSFLKGISE